jgi:hypothetical protein
LNGAAAALLLTAVWTGGAAAAAPKAAEQGILPDAPQDGRAFVREGEDRLSKEEDLMLNHGRHHAAVRLMESYPNEYRRWLGIMRDRHLIEAELLDKKIRLSELKAAAEASKNKKALESAEAIRREQMAQHAERLRELREQMRTHCKALQEQRDKLSDKQIRAALDELLKSAEAMNEAFRAKGKTLDEMIRALQS